MTKNKPSSAIISQFKVKIRNIFNENLFSAFICGSTALNHSRIDSDIDTFIILHKTDKVKEKKYAEFYRDTHLRLEKKYDHYGFILDTITLDNLFKIYTGVNQCISNMKDAACCNTDCILSMYQYAKIVVNILQSPKIPLVNREIIREYEDYAKEISKSDSYIKDPTDSFGWGNVWVPSVAAMKEFYDRLVERHLLEETPVGINLNRFYKNMFSEKINYSKQKIINSTICPLSSIHVSNKLKEIIRKQCISSIDMK